MSTPSRVAAGGVLLAVMAVVFGFMGLWFWSGFMAGALFMFVLAMHTMTHLVRQLRRDLKRDDWPPWG